MTPTLVHRAIFAAAETRSFERAEIVLKQVGGCTLDAKTVERLVHDVGVELVQRRDTGGRRQLPLARSPVDPPDLAVVECDGGRIRTREPGNGPGVHLESAGWRETKNACLVRAQRECFDHDPQPEPPESFCDPQHVAKIAETQALSVASPVKPVATRQAVEEEKAAPLISDWRPKRLVRTVLSSMAEAKEFGRQMAREARQRRFPEAKGKAFLGDGLGWNWSIWRKHFAAFVPILDFIHPLSYLFVTAKGLHPEPEHAWSQYLVWMRGCWQGEVEQVLEELRQWQTRIGNPPEGAKEEDPRQLVATAITYLQNNASRMDYPKYRQQGLPITTAWMESLVKEVNYRVKGTEMFWNDPEGAEAILQVRGAALCEDDRLADHLQKRSGCPFTRRPKSPKLPSRKNKS